MNHMEEEHMDPEPEVLRVDGDPTTCSRRLLTIHAHPDDESTKGGGSVTFGGSGIAQIDLNGGLFLSF